MTTPETPRPPYPTRREYQREQLDQHPGGGRTPTTTRPATSFATGETTSGLRSRRLEHERARARKRRRRRRVRTFLVLVVVIGLLGTAAWYAISALRQPGSQVESDDFPGPGTGTVEVTVERGDLGSDIGATLVDEGVVKSTAAFARAFEANKASGSIRPGTYTLRKEMSASDAVAALLDDANRSDNTVTVDAGQTVAQVVQKIVDVTGLPEDDVKAAFTDSDAIGLPEEAGGDAEGWLAPGAYEVSSSDTPESLAAEMVAATVKELDDLDVPSDQRQELLIKASILEREVNIDQYLPQVARVIENRLDDPDGETKGFLQMDSTVLYGLGRTGGIPTADELAKDTPYNTYIHKGLPPGPIAQPSVAALEATLRPADGDWLYFVTVNLDTGETLFATTHAEQEQNRKKLDEYCAANEGKC